MLFEVTDQIRRSPSHKCNIKLIEGSRLVYCNARPLSYALKELVDEEIDRLKNLDQTEKVTSSGWGSPFCSNDKKYQKALYAD